MFILSSSRVASSFRLMKRRLQQKSHKISGLSLLFCIFSSLVSHAEIIKGTGVIEGSLTLEIDATGIPKIKAKNEGDAYFGMCFVMARDRLFQLEYFKWASQGRVSEFFGAGGVDEPNIQHDLLIHLLKLDLRSNEIYKYSTRHTQVTLDRCAEGINSAVQGTVIPEEFTKLDTKPQTWTAQNLVQVFLYFLFVQESPNWEQKLFAGLVSSIKGNDFLPYIVGAKEAVDLNKASGILDYKALRTSEVPQKKLKWQKILTKLKKQNWVSIFNSPFGLFQQSGLGASFVLDGSIVATKRSVLGCDLQSSPFLPSLYYPVHVDIENSFEVTGVFFPGFPAFICAENPDVAWSFNNAFLDTSDLYVEVMKGSSALFKSKLFGAPQRQVLIKIKGEPDKKFSGQITNHGILLNTLFPALDSLGPIALKLNLFEEAFRLDGLLDLPTARNLDDLRLRAANISSGFHFLSVEKKGAIGYQLTGLFSRRPTENYISPVPGHSGDFEWAKPFKSKELPKLQKLGGWGLDSKVILSANSQVVESPVKTFGAGFRAEALKTELTSLVQVQKSALKLENLWQLFSGVRSELAIELRPFLLAPLSGHEKDWSLNQPGKDDGSGESPLATEDLAVGFAYRNLKAWTGDVSEGSSGALIYEVFVETLNRKFIEENLGPELYPVYLKFVQENSRRVALKRILSDVKSPVKERLNDWVLDAFHDSVRFLRRNLGTEVKQWTWGNLRNLTFYHPFSDKETPYALAAIARFGDASTVGGGGSDVLPNDSLVPIDKVRGAGPTSGPGKAAASGSVESSPAMETLPVEALPSTLKVGSPWAQKSDSVFRMLFEAGSGGGVFWINSTGMSGDPKSKDWLNQYELWKENKFYQTNFGGTKD